MTEAEELSGWTASDNSLPKAVFEAMDRLSESTGVSKENIIPHIDDGQSWKDYMKVLSPALVARAIQRLSDISPLCDEPSLSDDTIAEVGSDDDE